MTKSAKIKLMREAEREGGRKRMEGEDKRRRIERDRGVTYHMIAVSNMNSSTAALFVFVAMSRLTATYIYHYYFNSLLPLSLLFLLLHTSVPRNEALNTSPLAPLPIRSCNLRSFLFICDFWRFATSLTNSARLFLYE